MTPPFTTGPLAGMRVMDVSIMAAGPWTGALLGMLGAEVIKVEPPDGDGTRWVMPTQRGLGTNFIAMNVNKQDITLNFKHSDDRKLAQNLAKTCDVFVQNFRPGVIERLGLDWPTLQAINPRLVYCAISGFGETGPLAKAGCADPIMQAFSGFACSNGAAPDTLEAFRFTGFIDLTTASAAAEAILAALYDRETSGLGQKVEISMLEAALEIQFTRIAELQGAGLVPHPSGSENPAFAPDRAFRARDRWVFVTIHTDAEWTALRTALALEPEPRFATNRARVANRDALAALLDPIFASKPALWWLRLLARHGLTCCEAYEFDTFRHHAQITGNDMVATVHHPEFGATTVGGTPWHFSAAPVRVTPPSMPGADTGRVRTLLESQT